MLWLTQHPGHRWRPISSYPSLRDLDPMIESCCGQLSSLFPKPSFNGSDSSLGHSQLLSTWSDDLHPFNLLISHTNIPHLGFPGLLSHSQPQLLLPNPEDPPIDTQHQLLTLFDDVDPEIPLVSFMPMTRTYSRAHLSPSLHPSILSWSSQRTLS